VADTVVFLDANVLASPVTRTLVLAGGRADGLLLTWSAHVEAEADRHARGVSSRTSVVRRDILSMELSESAPTTEGLLTASAEDRQVLADAVLAGARFLITTDVDDFAPGGPPGTWVECGEPGLLHGAPFQRARIQGRRAHPCRGREEPTENGRRDPRHARPAPSHVTARFADVYETPPVAADLDQPSVLIRGGICMLCDAKLRASKHLTSGLCSDHQA